MVRLGKQARRRAGFSAIVLAVTVISAACGGSDDDSADSNSEEFTFWAMWEQSEPDAQGLQQTIDAFEEDTGITVNVEWQGRDVMDKLLAAQNTENVPDLVNQSTEKVSAAMVTTDQFTDLTDVYASKVYGEDVTVGEVIPEGYRAATTTEDGVPFLVPQFVNAYTIWYDGAAIPELNDNPPKEWSDFRALLDASLENGRAPLSLDADIGSYVSAWPGIALVRVLGAGGLNELVADPTAEGWQAPEVEAAMSELADLGQGGYFVEGYNSSKWPAIERKWFDGESDFLLMGSWLPLEGSTKGWAPDGFEMRTFNFPSFGDDYSVPIQAYGFAIPKKAKNEDAAAQFIAYMLNKETLATWANAIPILPPRTDIEASPQLQEVYELLQNNELSSPLDGIQAQYPDYYTKVFEPMARKLMLGEVSGPEFVAEIQKQQIDYWELQG